MSLVGTKHAAYRSIIQVPDMTGLKTMDNSTQHQMEAAFRDIDKALLESFKRLYPLLKRKFGLTGRQVIAAIAKAEMNNACTAITSTLPGATIEDGLRLRAELRATAGYWWDGIVARRRSD
jgi:hypothetical protein